MPATRDASQRSKTSRLLESGAYTTASQRRRGQSSRRRPETQPDVEAGTVIDRASITAAQALLDLPRHEVLLGMAPTAPEDVSTASEIDSDLDKNVVDEELFRLPPSAQLRVSKTPPLDPLTLSPPMVSSPLAVRDRRNEVLRPRLDRVSRQGSGMLCLS